MVIDSGRKSGLHRFGRRLVLSVWLALVPALLVGAPAQSAMMTNIGPRVPTNIGPRTPAIDSVGPRFDPSLHRTPGGGDSGAGGGSNNSGGASSGSSSRGTSNTGNSSGNGGGTKSQVTVRPARSGVPPANELRYFPDQVAFEVNGSQSDQQLIGLLNRFRLARLETRRIPLLNTTIYLARILDGSSVPAKVSALAANGLRAQPNYQFTMVQTAGAAQAETEEGPDSAQYALAKLHLGEAHMLARGDNVLVAVVDSGVDLDHPALAGVVEKSFDALNSSEGPHSHGTALAGIIAGHARLAGAAPAVHILAARAFSSTQGSTVSIIASIDWAVANGARVVNMSFAGPSDPLLGRALAAAHQKGVVLVAAAGNAGPKSPPLWPAADSHVIAVTATDYDDHLYAMANRGSHVAIAAPGVDILVANPGASYKMETGTSFSAGFVSGVAALVLQRKPQLTPDAVKKVLLTTAHDLGPKGRDDQFGAGLMDAFQAVNAVEKSTDAALQVPAH
jgi:subtilisin family serine protease